MKYLAMIQARMGSTRMPNKVLKEICGKPVLQWVIENVRKSEYVDEVMVVTSIDKNNLPIIKLCAEFGVRVFAGSENDVLDRYYQASKLLNPEYIIRITADCPLFDSRYLDAGIECMSKRSDYLHICPDTYPDGLDFEIVNYEALKKTWKDAKLASEREHVTLYIKNHPELFDIQEYEFPLKGCENYRLTLDEENDLEVIRNICIHFAGRSFITEDVIRYLQSHPDILMINSQIIRNEGLKKSLENDYIISEG